MTQADTDLLDPAAQEQVARAVELARDLAPDLSSVLITHFADAETLETLRPGSGGLPVVLAVNRAVAAALVGAGVQVVAQVADRGLFRRWMDAQADGPRNPLAWRNRAGFLRGAEALRLLGLDPALMRPPAPPAAGKTTLSPADRLVRAFAGEDDRAFRVMAEGLIAEGRKGVLEGAIRKGGERCGDDASVDLELELLEIAEGAEAGPSGWAGLVALPVALPPEAVPEAMGLVRGLLGSGLLGSDLPGTDVLAEGREVRFLPDWRALGPFERLEPTLIRRALLEVLEGREPASFPPAGPGELAERGFGVLLGVEIDWEVPAWEELAARGLPAPQAVTYSSGADAEGLDEDGAEEETPEEAAFRAGFDRWRMAVSEKIEGCVPLALVSPSAVVEEIEEFLDEAGLDTTGIEEIRDCVEMARREARDEEVVCRPEVIGESLEITLYTRSGRFLDSLTLPRDRLPVPAEEMPRLIEAFVPLVRDAPGR